MSLGHMKAFWLFHSSQIQLDKVLFDVKSLSCYNESLWYHTNRRMSSLILMSALNFGSGEDLTKIKTTFLSTSDRVLAAHCGRTTV